jgi:hypothetical protein
VPLQAALFLPIQTPVTFLQIRRLQERADFAVAGFRASQVPAHLNEPRDARAFLDDEIHFLVALAAPEEQFALAFELALAQGEGRDVLEQRANLVRELKTACRHKAVVYSSRSCGWRGLVPGT